MAEWAIWGGDNFTAYGRGPGYKIEAGQNPGAGHLIADTTSPYYS